METRESEQIAFELSRSGPGHVAWIEAGSRILYARYESPARRAPRSAIVDLIQAVYDFEPRMARKLLRARIGSTAEPTEMCLGMVKVAAKRLDAPVAPVDHGMEISRPLVQIAPSVARGAVPTGLRPDLERGSEEACMAEALRLKETVATTETRFASDRPIAALLVSREGEILAAAVNANASNRTRHAEVNLLQSYYERSGRPIPRGSRIFTTLKPCKMCAAMIWNCAEDLLDLEVIYAEDDPGPHGARTVLDLGTHERLRASRRELGLLALRLQRRLAPSG